MKKLITVICYFVLLFLVGHFGLHAQVYVSLNATGAGDGSSWADAYTSIPDAVSGAPKGSALWIAAGTYTLSQPLVLEEADLDLIGGFAGTESALDQRDFSQETILSADAAGDDLPGDLVSNSSDNLEHVLLISESTPMTIDGIVIEGGRGALSGTFADLAATGGGVFCVGEIDFINCKIRNNVARFGAGLYLINTGAIPGVYSFTNCEITGNEGNSFGGGIYAAFGGTTVSFKDCTFSKNKAANGAGAFFGGGSVVTQVQINDCLFTQNEASNLGGGFRFDGLATGSVTGCTFTGNSAPRGAGTGFFQATVTLDDCVWDGNTAVASGGDPALGGGIYIEEGCDIDISNSIIRENSAPEAGGGIFLLAIEGQTNNLDLVACMIDRNATDDLGGGLYSQDPANIGIEETVFMANEAIEGGGIFLSDDGEVTITDARFESNSATWGGAILFNDISSSMTLSGSDFIQNSCSNQGGALYNFEGSPWTISDCLFQSNSAGDWGGAGYLLADQSNSMCTFEGCRFVSNTSATSAGALYQNGGTFMVSNSVFFDNEASGDGIGNSISTNSDEGTGGPVLLLNNSFHEDAEGLGDVTPWAGSGEELDIRIQNCIFSGAGDSWKIEAGMIDQSSMGGNLLAGSAVDFPMDPTDLFDTDPLFVDASSGDLTLQSGSPAINSGVADGAPGTDLNGSARDDMPDRGAYEFGTTTSARDLVPLPGELVIKGNPVKNQLLAEWQGEILRDVSVAIVGSTGAVISLTRYDRLPNTLNLSIDHLPVGQYHLLLSTKMGIAGEAFVKM